MIQFSSGESDDDEEIVDYIAASNIFNRHFADRQNHFVDMRASDFHRRFTMTKETVSILLSKIESRLLRQSSRNRPVSPMDQLLCALRYYATGSQLITCGDFIGVHETTAGRIVHSVTHAIASLAPMYIKMPSTSEEQQTAAINFYEIACFPRCIGAIDCTHVKIISPGGQVPELYRNRKGVFTINVQAIVNANAVFTDVVARKHGSAHDSYIWDTSYQKRRFLEGAYGNKMLVGDSGYAQTPYMMVPLQTVTNSAQSLYNESQIRTRNVVERTFGIWKRRFPILAKGIQVKLKRVPGIIVATAVLHNICRMERDAEPLVEDDDLALNDYQPPPIQHHNETRMTPGQQARHNLIDQHFSRLT